MNAVLILALSMTLSAQAVAPQSTAGDRERLRAAELRTEMERAEDEGTLTLATERAAAALAAADRATGLPDSDLAMFLYDLARLYNNGADRQKARPLFERSLSLFERSVGPNHPSTALALDQLG